MNLAVLGEKKLRAPLTGFRAAGEFAPARIRSTGILDDVPASFRQCNAGSWASAILLPPGIAQCPANHDASALFGNLPVNEEAFAQHRCMTRQHGFHYRSRGR